MKILAGIVLLTLLCVFAAMGWQHARHVGVRRDAAHFESQELPDHA